MQNVGERQEMDWRTRNELVDDTVLETIVQVIPSHIMTRGSTKLLEVPDPTATQNVSETQETDAKDVCEIELFGVAVQFNPSQVSTRDFPAEPSLKEPTATQKDSDTQSTDSKELSRVDEEFGLGTIAVEDDSAPTASTPVAPIISANAKNTTALNVFIQSVISRFCAASIHCTHEVSVKCSPASPDSTRNFLV
jgi:hypothetical protein